jgi:hypothetical protein
VIKSTKEKSNFQIFSKTKKEEYKTTLSFEFHFLFLKLSSFHFKREKQGTEIQSKEVSKISQSPNQEILIFL